MPSNGWGKRRSFLYSRVVDELGANGFARDQYSVYSINNTTPIIAYTAMIQLTRTPDLPVGMIPTTVQSLSMFHQPHANIMDVTADVRLEGTHTPINPVNAIIPANLVPPVGNQQYHAAPHVPPPIGRATFPGNAVDYLQA